MFKFLLNKRCFQANLIITLLIAAFFTSCKQPSNDPNDPYDPNTLPFAHFTYKIAYDNVDDAPVAHITCVNTSSYSNRWEWIFQYNETIVTDNINEPILVTYSAAIDREITVKLIAYSDVYLDGVIVDTFQDQNIKVIPIKRQQ
ncbi:MAG: hypothetical protein LBH92_05440 [Bacteroidales bacterium]|jgi:hypothetical protein|nr:hypothetical protein [Bacteroidales bacterium]